jgi:DUF4097 and DUF4098 domain-containing protein YvlB
MRRGSLVGPLLLIGIGVLFLARNVMPDLPLLDYLAQYWPFLLILWGGLRVLEIAIWAIRDRPLPRYGISGGEWVLVVFLCMFGTSLHAARGFTSWLPRAGFEWGGLEVFGESYEYPVSAEATAAANPKVVIEGFQGNARIVGGDGTAVKVTGHQTIRAVDQATADRTSKDTRVEVTSQGNQVVIRVVQPQNDIFDKDRSPFRRRVSADLDITVPRGATIAATGRNGDFDVSGVTGSVEIDGTDTSARLESIGGDVRLDLQGSDIVRAVNVKGSFELKGRGNDIDLEKIAGQVSVDGSWGGLAQMRELAKPIRWKGPQTELTATALPGELRMTIGDISIDRITGPLRIDSSSKDVSIANVNGSTNLDLQRGDVQFSVGSVPLAEVSVRLQSGNVELSLPDGVKFNMNAVTQRGEAYSDYLNGVKQNSDGRRGASITSSAGGPTIDVQVNRGNITLRKTGKDATAPAGLPPRTVQQ